MASESTTPIISSQPPQPQPIISTSTPAPAPPAPTTKPPVTLAPTAHLDPSAYVRGAHPIQISSNTLIHPRVHLLSLHSPLTIGENSIVSEKAVLGGPLPQPPVSSDGIADSSPDNDGISSEPTEIGRHVHIHPNVTVQSGVKVGSFAVLEASVTVGHDVSIGRHSKVCAGITVGWDVPEWTVVYGGTATQRRRRRRQGVEEGGEQNGGAELTEAERVKAMDREREGTVGILRAAAARAVASRSARR